MTSVKTIIAFGTGSVWNWPDSPFSFTCHCFFRFGEWVLEYKDVGLGGGSLDVVAPWGLHRGTWPILERWSTSGWDFTWRCSGDFSSFSSIFGSVIDSPEIETRGGIIPRGADCDVLGWRIMTAYPYPPLRNYKVISVIFCGKNKVIERNQVFS
ncbi:hypothetical protein AKJ65_01505 [candidate division MSBL1 archaeon SCGC-AAA259E19]|uniref:Uncharacterized protein n=1 Tax=candidate division MSBL1 archaeon SCGC-AAA259E19 TaxID=1698264 RepID=A0A133UMW0_9EURY|nr:hypothetical protein AKJ65_01505 [candidate division MSBL1 archaeon SCGC-AAA259E19]